MLINNRPLKTEYEPKQQNFGGLETTATQILRYLNTSPAIGATFVDLGSMSAPRTIVDFSRGFDAGLETGIREGSGTGNHALIGTYGILAGFLLSQGINNKYKVKSDRVFANFESIDTIGTLWNDIVHNNNNAEPAQLRKALFNEILNKAAVQGKSGGNQVTSISREAINSAMTEISGFIDKNPSAYNMPNQIHNNIKSILTYSTASESDFVLKAGEKALSTDLDTLLKSSFSLGKLFSEPKALDEFKNTADFASNKFIKALKGTKLRSSLLGVAIGMGIGASIQPFNVWLTKKRTGKEGFVGVEGDKKDKSSKFKALKLGTAAAFLAFAYSTIVDNVFKTPFKQQASQLLNRLQFKGIIPSIPQFKAIYAFTIASRLMAARDKNELRESATKDFLGFVNWLILGDFVQKIVAISSNKKLTNYDEKLHGVGIINKFFNSKVKVKTHDEILFEELKKIKIDKKELYDVRGKMLSAKALIKKFGDLLPNLKTRLRGKNIAQFSGYLYSAIVLGVLIPKLNIAITKKLHNSKQDETNINYEFLKAFDGIKF